MKLRCDRCGVVADGPIARQLAAIPLAEVSCACGGRLRPHDDTFSDAELFLYGMLAVGAGLVLRAPLVTELGAALVKASLDPVSRRARDDFDRDTKRLAASSARLDRDDPTLN